MYNKPKAVSTIFKPNTIIIEETPKLLVFKEIVIPQNVVFSTVGETVEYGVEFWGGFELGEDDSGLMLLKPQVVFSSFKPKVK